MTITSLQYIEYYQEKSNRKITRQWLKFVIDKILAPRDFTIKYYSKDKKLICLKKSGVKKLDEYFDNSFTNRKHK